MKVTLESTSKTTTLIVDGAEVPVRIWEGVTAGGIRCHAYIALIAVSDSDDSKEFERDLREQRAPSPDIERAIPLRMVL